MIEYLVLIFGGLWLNCLLIWGVYFVTHNGRILEGVRIATSHKLGAFWSKPIFECPVCMSSFWGTLPIVLMIIVSVFLIGKIYLIGLLIIPLWIILLAGLNGIVEGIIFKNKSIIELKKLLVDDMLLEQLLNK